MAQGFVINALLNASRFIRGVKDMDDALDDLEGALEDAQGEVEELDRTGERAFEDMADAADDAADETNTLEKRLRDVRDAAKDAGNAGDRAGKDIESGMDRARKGAQDFKDEANDTAREAAASFDGSAESIGDAFQEVAANAFAGFGPAGAVAGIAAAAGIGLAVAGFEAVSEAQTVSEEATAEWADRFVEAGGRIISNAQVVAEVVAIATDPERYKVAAENAKNWGVDEGTAMRALAGDATALTVVQQSLDDQAASLREVYDQMRGSVTDTATGYRNMTEDEKELERQHIAGTRSLGLLNAEMEAGAERARTVSDALIGLINDSESATKEVDELGNAVYTLPDGTTIFVDAETGQATQNVDKFKGDVDGIPEVVNTTVKVGVDSSAWDRWVPRNKYGEVVARYGRVAV